MNTYVFLFLVTLYQRSHLFLPERYVVLEIVFCRSWGSLAGLVINGVLNAILIFGLFGAPALGVSGAAIATLIARIVECLIILVVVTLKVKPLRLS